MFNKINILFREMLKMLLILISLLNHKNWDLRQLGLSGRKAKVFFHEWKTFMQNLGNKLRETLKSRLEWKIKHSPNVFLINVKGIIFHSWKLSSYSFLIHEHCKLIIFDFTSTFFNRPYWKYLQIVLEKMNFIKNLFVFVAMRL